MNKAESALTRKLGPLPVWAWAGLVVAAWFLFLRGGSASAGTQLPYTPRAPSSGASQQPDPGGGGGDLLSALHASGGGYGSMDGADTGALTAPTVVSDLPPDTPGAPTQVIGGVTYAGYDPANMIPTNPDTSGMTEEEAVAAQRAATEAMDAYNAAQASYRGDALDRYLYNKGIDIYAGGSQQTSQAMQYVSPHPVDGSTSSVTAPTVSAPTTPAATAPQAPPTQATPGQNVPFGHEYAS